MAIIEGAIGRDAVTQVSIAGGAAGDHTVTGIKPRDTLVSVLQIEDTDVSDLTSEFSISADDTINNADGTATTGDALIVTYLSVG